MTIRPMVQSDLPGVLAVVSDAFDRDHAQRGHPEFNEMFGATAWRPFFYVAETRGNVVGVSGYRASWLAYGVYELFWVGVLKGHEGKGVGKKLVSRCLSDLATVAAQVILVTEKPEFFKKNGFKCMGRLPTKNGSKDVLMFKSMLG